ncbi:hypothetical protein CPLU01_12894 [Colletotrichum plurivorum]|uniref:DUF8035 domain-containing protein n=1 Tax=Colletotrichum plurivorum TaxID=2175906 RepID=A0A8H6JV14_9PEZI|nr:hypothetical protein CPLU01_12894 [Colletotrichum plurivorum]
MYAESIDDDHRRDEDGEDVPQEPRNEAEMAQEAAGPSRPRLSPGLPSSERIDREYPRKGKTRIPTRLISKSALIELSYPYTEEGDTTIIHKALG